MSISDEPILDLQSDTGRNRSDPCRDVGLSIRNLLDSQIFCILCTQGQGQPYGSLIAYVHSPDLKTFYFATSRPTRKFKLLRECDKVALVIDSRCQHPQDMTGIEAVTVTGRAIDISARHSEYDEALELMKKRYPYLQWFLVADSTALFRMDAIRYLYVTRFQEVSQWTP